MKQTYKRLVLAIIYLLGLLTSNAQYTQYELQQGSSSVEINDDLTDSKSTSATETGEFNWTLEFNSYANILALQSAMERAYRSALNRWLAQQENYLKQEIENQMQQKFSDFKTAQVSYFNYFEDNSLGKSRGISYEINSLSTSYYNKAKELRKQEISDLGDLNSLNIRQNEVFAGNISNSKVGYKKIQGKYLKDVNTRSSLLSMQNISSNSYAEKENLAARYISWDLGLSKLSRGKSKLTSEYAKKRVSQYNSLSFENKILLMSVYLHISSNEFSGVLIAPPRSINGVSIADYWNSTILLAEGKKLAPAISGDATLLEPGYIEGLRKRCGIFNTIVGANIVLPGDSEDPISDPFCDKVAELDNQRNQIIQKAVDKLFFRPATEVKNMQQFVTNTWASRKNCPGPGICWRKEVGNFEGRASLYYNERSEVTYYGRVYQHYKLANGDILSRVQQPVSSGSSEANEVIWYLPQNADTWYEYRLPPRTYTKTDLDFLFEKFWDGAALVGRYVIPIEDVIILIDGKDFDGVDQSKTLAGVGIIFAVVPGSKLIKPITALAKGSTAWGVILKSGTKTVVIKSANALAKFRSAAGKQFFYSGRTVGVGGAAIAETIAKKYGGETIEMVARRQSLNMPADRLPASNEIWRQASETWANTAEGVVRVVLGSDVLPTSTWIVTELPALLTNKKVTKIISIDPKTLKETIIHTK